MERERRQGAYLPVEISARISGRKYNRLPLDEVTRKTLLP